MNLSDATAVIRPRNAWESMDLGFRFVQRDFKALVMRWVIATLPWAAIAFAIGKLLGNPALAYLIFWWLKPAFGRVPLQYLSRRLFNGDVNQVNFWTLCFKIPFSHSAWRHLTYLRFSLTRSFVLPIYQLEGQNSKTRSPRIQTILSKDYGAAAWLTLTLFFVALVAYTSLATFLMTLWQPEDPLSTPASIFGQYLDYWSRYPELIVYIDFFIFYAVQSVIELFYVGAGFALYLNRRTHLEAWDIELAFRRIVARIAKGTHIFVVLLFAGLMLATPATSYAQQDNEGQISIPEPVSDHPETESERAVSRDAVKEIYEAHDFGKTVKTEQWMPIRTNIEDADSDEKTEKEEETATKEVDFFDLIASALKYLIIGAILIIIGSWIIKNRELFAGTSDDTEDTARSERIHSDDQVREQFVPNPDVPQQVLSIWQRGDSREALSYLYRSALSYLTNKHQLVIDESDTEGDCLRLVRNKAATPVASYFQRVTKVWRNLAYGDIVPDTAVVEDLCGNWHQLSQAHHER